MDTAAAQTKREAVLEVLAFETRHAKMLRAWEKHKEEAETAVLYAGGGTAAGQLELLEDAWMRGDAELVRHVQRFGPPWRGDAETVEQCAVYREAEDGPRPMKSAERKRSEGLQEVVVKGRARDGFEGAHASDLAEWTRLREGLGKWDAGRWTTDAERRTAFAEEFKRGRWVEAAVVAYAPETADATAKARGDWYVSRALARGRMEEAPEQGRGARGEGQAPALPERGTGAVEEGRGAAMQGRQEAGIPGPGH